MRRSKSENNGELFEADENPENQKQPSLSGAYIRSFVKQLTSSRTKEDSPNMREKASLEREGVSRAEEQDPPGKPHQNQHKKQVRRRFHTRKPYQEKLLNMAEARREIVSALKLHRAAMKRATEKQKTLLESGPEFRPEEFKSGINNPTVYASNSDNNIFYSPGFYSFPSIPPPPIFQDQNLDFALPNQTLGLNHNLQDFINAPSSIYSSSSPSTSSSSPPPSAAAEKVPVVGGATAAAAEVVAEFGHLNKIERFKSTEIRAEEFQRDEEYFVSSSSPFDEVMKFPAWLNANESCLQHVNDYCNEDYFRDFALPCMDIEEIEGMDGDWLA